MNEKEFMQKQNELERKRLLEEVRQEKKEEKKKEKPVKISWKERIADVLHLHNDALSKLSTEELGDFVPLEEPGGQEEKEEKKKEEQESMEEGSGIPEDSGKKQLPPDEALVSRLGTISGRSAIAVFGLTGTEYVKAMLGVPFLQEVQRTLIQCALSVFGAAAYPCEDQLYAVILEDCRLNQNGLDKMCNDLQKAYASARTSPANTAIAVCLAVKEDTPEQLLRRLQTACRRQIQAFEETHSEYALERDRVNLEELTEGLRRTIEANAIEQARRQFEVQMEECGEIDPQERIVIRDASNMSPEEYDSFLSPTQQMIKEQAKARYVDDDILVEQVLHNIRKHNTIEDPLYLIAIASVDMNTLCILEDVTDFELMCEDQDITMFQCSYIYSISKSGGHWYGNNHATREIEELFNTLSDIIVENHGRFRKELLYEVPNIGIFKDIYLQ